MLRNIITTRAIAIFCAAFITGSAVAQERGNVTNLPIPRFVSLKASEGNVRRGPSLTHRIDWVFKHRDMPLEITAEYGHWRRVRDRDGQGGWVHYSLLSGVRTVVIESDLLALYVERNDQSRITAYLELGVVGRMGTCDPTWCRIKVGSHQGWAQKAALWGVKPDEIRE